MSKVYRNKYNDHPADNILIKYKFTILKLPDITGNISLHFHCSGIGQQRKGSTVCDFITRQ